MPNGSGFAQAIMHAADLVAPGTLVPGPPAATERNDAVTYARAVVSGSTAATPMVLNLARQYLRALGLS